MLDNNNNNNNKAKDSYLTFIAKLITIIGSQTQITKQCMMIYRQLNKSISLVIILNDRMNQLDIKTHKQLYPDHSIIINNGNSIVSNNGNIMNSNNNNILVQQFIIGKQLSIYINNNNNHQNQYQYQNNIKIKGQLIITNYADQYTKTFYTLSNSSSTLQKMLVIIKPGFIENQLFGQIFTVLESFFVINRFKMFLFTQQNLQKYIVNQKMNNSSNNLSNFKYLTSSPSFAFQITGDNYLLPKIKKIAGPQNPIDAKKTQPQSLRAKYGVNIIQNCCYYSKNPKTIQQEIDFIFSNQVKQVKPKLTNSCLVLIKPHLVINKQIGQLLTFMLQRQVKINAIRFQSIDKVILKKYLDLYKFLPQYAQNLQHFQSEKSMFMEITINNSQNPFQYFKKLCGPYDPAYAKKINPQSIRAVFGIDRVKNAIHCTQLLQDTQTEIKLLFQL